MRMLRKRIDLQEIALDPLHEDAGDGAVLPTSTESDFVGVEKPQPSVAKAAEEYEGQGEIHRCVPLPEREGVR
jgi:hypothetical protein